MTSEAKKPTEKFVESSGAEFAYAYDPGGKAARFFGVSGIPHAVLIDYSGKVVWRGHPSSLSNSQVKKALGPVLPSYPLNWPKEASKVKKHLFAGKLAKALAEAEKLKDDRQVAKSLIALIDARVSSLDQAIEGKDYLGALTRGEVLVKELKGLEQADVIGDKIAALKKDGEAKKVMKAQELIASIPELKYKRKKDADKRIAELREIIELYPDTIPAKQAADMIDWLKTKRLTLK